MHNPMFINNEQFGRLLTAAAVNDARRLRRQANRARRWGNLAMSAGLREQANGIMRQVRLYADADYLRAALSS